MLILYFCSETNGIPDWGAPSDAPHQPVAIELWASLVDTATGEAETIYSYLDFPSIEPDFAIAPEAQAVNQIDLAMLSGNNANPPADVMQRFLDLAERAGQICCWSRSFDLRIMRITAARALGQKWKPEVPVISLQSVVSSRCDDRYPSINRACQLFLDHSAPDRMSLEDRCKAMISIDNKLSI